MEPMSMWNIIKQSLRFAVKILRKERQFGTVVPGRCFSRIALSTISWIKFGYFFPRLCVRCIASSALLCGVLGLDLLGFIVKRTWQVCAPCEEGNNVSHLHTKRIQVQVKFGGFAKFEILFSSSAIQVLFCLVFVQSTMRASLLVIQDCLQGTTIPLVFLAQSLSGLIFLCRWSNLHFWPVSFPNFLEG